MGDVNIKGIEEELRMYFKLLCVKNRISMTAALIRYMEKAVKEGRLWAI
ncbi:hypothetical protein ES705_09406 [subsurface metagenome]